MTFWTTWGILIRVITLKVTELSAKYDQFDAKRDQMSELNTKVGEMWDKQIQKSLNLAQESEKWTNKWVNMEHK
jgi:hypothetical protein